MNKEKRIDAVILWVDGNDEEHREKILPYVDDKSIITSTGFKTRYEQVNEIHYTVDSILKFAPFVGTIFIITDQQTPGFLKHSDRETTYKKVKLIDHTDIFKGYEEHLPTFNCRPIETCMHRIPDLAEQFIYFNDDFFLINPTQPSDFFTDDGYPILRGFWQSLERDHKKLKKPDKATHKRSQDLAATTVGFDKLYRFKHTPHPLRKSRLQEFYENNPALFENNIKYKFRNKNQFSAVGIGNHLEIKNGSFRFESNLNLVYFRSYKKPFPWYYLKLKILGKEKLFLTMQSLDNAPKKVLNYLLKWLGNRVKK